MENNPLITIAIPAYNRAHLLPHLLDSIIEQSFQNYEILILEDFSPERKKIKNVVEEYKKSTDRIRYYENKANFGYDKNLRTLIQKSKGKYILFMGNDDLLAKDALKNVSDIITNNKNVGCIIRSYTTFRDDENEVVGTFKYVKQEHILPASYQSTVISYRRSVVISGMVFDRDTCLKYESDVVDGTLLYQLYLILKISKIQNVVITPHILAYYRLDTPPDFGSSENETNFTPNEQTALSSFKFIEGMWNIPMLAESNCDDRVVQGIRKDLANYSLPFLSIQRNKGLLQYSLYAFQLSRLGLGSYPIYWFYFLVLFFLGNKITDKLIQLIKYFYGSAPQIGFKLK